MPGEDRELTLEEYKRVSDLFGERFRTAAESRIAALEARLHNLRRLGSRPFQHPFGGDARLRVVGITPDGSELVGDMLAHLLIQVLIHGARRSGPGGGQSILFVVGADALRRRHLERLDQLATQRGIRLAYMFRHVRDEATDLLGGGGAAFFMRVGNAKEASTVAEFIGREHKFVLHQLTRSSGESVTHTVGDNTSETLTDQSSETFSKHFQIRSPMSTGNSYTSGQSRSRTWGESRSVATGTSTSESPGQQRVYEFAVEPYVLQTLPETAFLFVDSVRELGPRARLGDCNPDILSLPNVSAEPFTR
jgi:hypothetical protein